MIKKAWAVWKGGIKDGGGTISTETGVLNAAPYGFKSRFENGGTVRETVLQHPFQPRCKRQYRQFRILRGPCC